MGTLPDYTFDDEARNEVRDICMRNVPFWNTLKPEDIDVEFISSAVTNRVFKALLKPQHRPSFPLNQVILKKKMSYNSLMSDTELQFEVLKFMSDTQCGPKLVGRDGDYIIQEFVEGTMVETAAFQNLSVLTGIATSVAKLHKTCTKQAPKHWDRTPFVYRDLEKWLTHLERIINKLNLDFSYSELVEYHHLVLRAVDYHVKNTKSLANDVLFCHNDLFSLNILDIQYGIYLIDFDLSAFNYVGWEIASFFREMIIVYDTGAPPYFNGDRSLELSPDFKSIFVSVYLSELLDKNVLPTEPVVGEFLDSLEVHYLLVDLYWTFWGIVMKDKPAKEQNKPLQLEAYAKLRETFLKGQLKLLKDRDLLKY